MQTVKIVDTKGSYQLKYSDELVFNEYLNFIVRLNQEQTYSFNLDHFIESYGFGLLEELQELKVAKAAFLGAATIEEAEAAIVKETGDVFAYACLIFGSYLLRYTTNDRRDYTLDLTDVDISEPNFTLVFAGSLKRISRGDYNCQELTHTAAKYAIAKLIQVYDESDFTFEYIYKTNKSKLEARLSNTGTFHGSGDR